MNKDILNYNNEGKHHGYQERYHNDKLTYRGNSKNGICIGYTEWHWPIETEYYIR